nr:uridine kinase [Bacillus pinisoli]
MNKSITFERLLYYIGTYAKKQSTLLIGIDGCGGAGKSTLANMIKEHYTNVTIIHNDDFYLPSSELIDGDPTKKPIGADFDWKRLLEQVLLPLSQDKEGFYQRYDWNTDKLAEWHTVPTGEIVIVEGVYCTRQELEHLYDIKIWVNCPSDTRLLRGIERDGEGAREMWENNWMVAEELYVQKQKPHERADFLIDGTV